MCELLWACASIMLQRVMPSSYHSCVTWRAASVALGSHSKPPDALALVRRFVIVTQPPPVTIVPSSYHGCVTATPPVCLCEHAFCGCSYFRSSCMSFVMTVLLFGLIVLYVTCVSFLRNYGFFYSSFTRHYILLFFALHSILFIVLVWLMQLFDYHTIHQFHPVHNLYSFFFFYFRLSKPCTCNCILTIIVCLFLFAGESLPRTPRSSLHRSSGTRSTSCSSALQSRELSRF